LTAAPFGFPTLSSPANQHGPAREHPDLCRVADAAPLLVVSTTPRDVSSLFHPARCGGVAAHGSIDKMHVIMAGRRRNKAGHQGRGLAMCSPASHSGPLRRREKPFQLVRKRRGAVERHPHHPIARPELDRATDRSGRCRWTHSAVCDGAMALPSESAHRVFVPTLLSSGHRTYGVGESSGRIRLRDKPGARRQLAGAGPDAAGPDQDADPG
jgi:hypothetical protein